MTTIDECLERLRAEWRAVARYRVYRAGWYPEKTKVILASGLGYEDARRRAGEESELLKLSETRVQGRFGDDIVGFELENGSMLKRP